MLARLRSRLSYANVVSTICLFFVVAGGSAYAAHEMILSSDIVDGEVKTPDLGSGAVTRTKISNGEVIRDKINNNAVNDTKVADNALGGADIDESTLNIDESTLGQVPSARSALLGGIGRWKGGGSCDPESFNVVDCGFTTLNLPMQDPDDQPRVLVIGTVTAHTEPDSDFGDGICRLATSLNTNLRASTIFVQVGEFRAGEPETFPLVAVTPQLPADRPSTVDFGVECNQSEFGGAIRYSQVGVSAVALSPN